MQKIRKRSMTNGEEIMETDEFLTFSDRVAEYVMANTRQVFVAVGIVIVAIAIGAGVYYWNEGQKNKSAYLLFQASRYMQAAEAQPDPAKAETDLASARTVYENIVKDYGSSAEALSAHYQLGNIEALKGKWDEALKHYEAATAKGGDALVVQAARQKVAYAKWAKGDKEGALKDFDQLMGAGNAPKDLLHLEKGKLLEELGKKEDAVTEYDAIIGDFKQSPFIGEATRRFVALGGEMPKPEAALPTPAAPAAGEAETKPAETPAKK
ncbi:MAG: tetratricopeptide repeat protein [Nitrospirota bacterium]|nr:tetratricopeptide repeat protein [Nitrospirota bacterium]